VFTNTLICPHPGPDEASYSVHLIFISTTSPTLMSTICCRIHKNVLAHI